MRLGGAFRRRAKRPTPRGRGDGTGAATAAGVAGPPTGPSNRGRRWGWLASHQNAAPMASRSATATYFAASLVEEMGEAGGVAAGMAAATWPPPDGDGAGAAAGAVGAAGASNEPDATGGV